MSAKLSGKQVALYGLNANCAVQFVQLVNYGVTEMVKIARGRMKAASAGAFACMALAAATPAQAYTECTVNVLDVYSGDGGYLWIHYTNGGSSYVAPGAAIQQTVAAISMTALVANRQIRVRYSTDGAVCTTAGRSDLIGVYLT